ncbi:MAG: helix-turn-helix domain-containing protein [Treponema sp.]|jgi:transcriptional regulator with XRE-family HTH domain|nr:helix-turn-helix domain-containing protein [Treponema sp.]
MKLSERISIIIKENNLKQKELAAMIGVTESYIPALLRKPNINPSQSFANLIEEKLGYTARWVLTGDGEKFKRLGNKRAISDVHKKAIMQLEKMPEQQAYAILAFINSEAESSLKDTRTMTSHNKQQTGQENRGQVGIGTEKGTGTEG